MLDYRDLKDEQKDGINFILRNKVGCLAPECGAGKTVQGLTAFEALRRKKTVRKMLVTCPAKAVKETWDCEHKKWKHLEHLKVVTLTGTATVRSKTLKKDADVYVISYNLLEWLTTEKHPEFGFIFADEGSCLRSPGSKWRKYLIEVAPRAKYRIISTATPSPHDAMDYWGLCKYMDDGICLDAPTITDFRAKYCLPIPIPGSRGQRWVLRKGSVEEIEAKVKHLFFTTEADSAVKIPIKTVIARVNLAPESQAVYDKVRDEQCLNSIIYNETGQYNAEDSLNALSLSVKLGQMSGGFVYYDESLRLSDDVLRDISDPRHILNMKKRSVIHLFDDRIIAMKKLIAGIHKKHGDNQNIVITYLYKYDLELLQKAFPQGIADTEDNIVERWNLGEIKYLFLQYGRSSKSLNLQKGGHIMAAYSSTFNWEDTYQIIRRLARQGQEAGTVYLYVLHINGTVDDNKQRTLSGRSVNHRNFQKKILDAIRRNRK